MIHNEKRYFKWVLRMCTEESKERNVYLYWQKNPDAIEEHFENRFDG